MDGWTHTATSGRSATTRPASGSARPRRAACSSTCAGRPGCPRSAQSDTQPFPDPAGRFVFSHNGDLAGHRPWRERFRAQGRIHGRADSEVGQRWLEDAWSTREPAGHLLGALHDAFGGEANFALLEADGAVHHYAGNPENPVFTFGLGPIRVASTGIYSLDRSLFRFVAPGATDRRLIPLRTTVGLD